MSGGKAVTEPLSPITRFSVLTLVGVFSFVDVLINGEDVVR